MKGVDVLFTGEAEELRTSAVAATTDLGRVIGGAQKRPASSAQDRRLQNEAFLAKLDRVAQDAKKPKVECLGENKKTYPSQ